MAAVARSLDHREPLAFASDLGTRWTPTPWIGPTPGVLCWNPKTLEASVGTSPTVWLGATCPPRHNFNKFRLVLNGSGIPPNRKCYCWLVKTPVPSCAYTYDMSELCGNLMRPDAMFLSPKSVAPNKWSECLFATQFCGIAGAQVTTPTRIHGVW